MQNIVELIEKYYKLKEQLDIVVDKWVKVKDIRKYKEITIRTNCENRFQDIICEINDIRDALREYTLDELEEVTIIYKNKYDSFMQEYIKDSSKFNLVYDSFVFSTKEEVMQKYIEIK